MCLCLVPTKMADELERVRISAAELRAEASNFTTHGDSIKVWSSLNVYNNLRKVVVEDEAYFDMSR